MSAAESSERSALAVTTIEPTKVLRLDWRELYAYRELFYYFAWRDIKVRYKQTAIGAAWAVFQPFITMVVFTIFFNKVAGIEAGDGVPYAIFSYSGLLFWNCFSNALTRSSSSLVESQGVITKVYFPRIIPPISATIVALVDFFFALLVFAGLMLFYGIAPGVGGLLFLLPAVLITFLTSAGLGILLATLNVRYRDVKQALPFFIQTGLFLTPVIYPITLVPERYQWLLYLNPMTGVITAVRDWTIGQGSIEFGMLAISTASAVVLFVGGILYFKTKEREFADII